MGCTMQSTYSSHTTKIFLFGHITQVGISPVSFLLVPGKDSLIFIVTSYNIDVVSGRKLVIHNIIQTVLKRKASLTS